MQLNQPHAPQIYIGLVPVTKASDGTLAFDGAGVPVEWGVRMHRFRQHDMLDQVAQRGEIDHHLATRLAQMVARSHNRAPHVQIDDMPGVLTSIAQGVSDNLQEFSHELPNEELAVFEDRLKQRISACRRVLMARARSGFVRHCHGDLHLQNIVLMDGTPTLFDAIEFSDRIAQVDVLYDLAFLLADLDHRGLRVTANIVLNRYLFYQNQNLNIYGLGLLPLYQSLRHAIRAMVTLHRLEHIDKSERAKAIENSRAFFSSAFSCLDPVPPRLIAVGGFSGSGKSTLAQNLAPFSGTSPGALHLRSDLERKSYFKVSETDRLDSNCYTQEISDRIYKALYRKARMALKVGHAVIVDAVFSKENERRKIEDIARQLGVPFDGLWLAAPAQEMIDRVEGRTGDASDATADVVKLQMATGPGVMNWDEVDSSGTVDETLKLARKRIDI